MSASWFRTIIKQTVPSGKQQHACERSVSESKGLIVLPSVSLAELKPGAKISSDVITPLGGVLYPKGKVILPRDLEILEAFLIKQVEIEGEEADNSAETAKEEKGNVPADSNKEQGKNVSTLQTEYTKMLKLMKTSYRSVVGASLPILELRGGLEALIAHIKDYHVLQFTPPQLTEADYIYHKAVLSALTCYRLAQWCGYPSKDWMQMAFAGLLHDIGNAKVDPDLLDKRQPLDAGEREEVRKHTTYGYQLLRNVTAINEGVRLAALQHHEKIDGSGYPLKLEGSQIHDYAKIVAVSDIFHSMTLERAYKKAQSPYLVLEELHTESFGKLDPSIVQTFIQKTTELYNGIKVKLNDGRQGEIIFTDRNHPTRPMVQCGSTIVNLVQQREFFIQEIVV